LEQPFDENIAYSSHWYIKPAFGSGSYPGKYQDEYWDFNELKTRFSEEEGTIYTNLNKVPLWVGEFGSVLTCPKEYVSDRLKVAHDQIRVFEEFGAHWTIWTYKDAGIMGTVTMDPDSKYMQRVQPVMELKEQLAVDAWGSSARLSPIREDLLNLSAKILSLINETGFDKTACSMYLTQMVLSGYTAAILQEAYARCFTGMSDSELDDVMKSFSLENCKINPDFKSLLTKCMTD